MTNPKPGERKNSWTPEFLKRNPEYLKRIEPKLKAKWDGASDEQRQKWSKETGSGGIWNEAWDTIMAQGGSTAEVTMEQMAGIVGERINSALDWDKVGDSDNCACGHAVVSHQQSTLAHECTICECKKFSLERKNNTELCGKCGASMTMFPDAVVNTCGVCGERLVGAQTPAVETLDNFCRGCRHPIAPEHDDFGCHIPGCSCTMSAASIVDQIAAVLPNAVEPTEPVTVQAAPPPPAEKKNGVAICSACLAAHGPRQGAKTITKGDIAHIVIHEGQGHTEVACGDESVCPCQNSAEHKNASENRNAKKRPCPLCKSANTLCIFDSEGGRFQMGAKPLDGYECHDCQNVWSVNPKTGQIENATGNQNSVEVARFNGFSLQQANAAGEIKIVPRPDVRMDNDNLFESVEDAKAWIVNNGVENRNANDVNAEDWKPGDRIKTRTGEAGEFVTLNQHGQVVVKMDDGATIAYHPKNIERENTNAAPTPEGIWNFAAYSQLCTVLEQAGLDIDMAHTAWSALPPEVQKKVTPALMRLKNENANSMDTTTCYYCKKRIVNDACDPPCAAQKRETRNATPTEACANFDCGHSWAQHGSKAGIACQTGCGCQSYTKPIRQKLDDQEHENAASQAAFEAHTKECAGCANALSNGTLDGMCEEGNKLLESKNAADICECAHPKVSHLNNSGMCKQCGPETEGCKAYKASEFVNAAGSELAKKIGVKHPKDLPFDQPNTMGCNGCSASRPPLNADGYCKECAAQQGDIQNGIPGMVNPPAHDGSCELCGRTNVRTERRKINGAEMEVCADGNGCDSKENTNSWTTKDEKAAAGAARYGSRR